MGGYAAYVWPSYGIVFLVLAGLLWASLRSLARSEEEMRALRGEQENDDEA